MKMKSQLTVAGLLIAGLLATGCSQQQSAGGQQVSATPAPAPAPVAEPAPAPAPAPAVRQAPAPTVPKVKAKGNFKGKVQMDPASQGAMQQYQK